MKKFSLSRKLGGIVLTLALLTCSFTVIKKFRKSKVDLTVLGYIHMADGLGRQGPELLEAFGKEMKVNMKLTRKLQGAHVPKKFKQLVSPRDDDWGKVVVFEDILWAPKDQQNIRKLRSCPERSIRIAYSMYEATKIPQEWVEILNRHFDAVAVPAPFLIDVYRKSGVTLPIFEVPLAVNLKPFLERPLKKSCQEKMVFANFSAGTDRKNHVLLIDAFHQAFGNDPSVELQINFRYGEKVIRNQITKKLAQIGASNIQFTQNCLSKKDYIKAFENIDCYVSPSKGEGFSIQPREAMALGIPVIVTNNTGQIPICQSNLALSVSSPHRMLAMNPWGDYYGYNFTCTQDQLAAALIEMKENYDRYLSVGQKARVWASGYLYENLKPLYATLISPKEVILGKEDKITPTSLHTTSEKLFRKYKKNFPNAHYENDTCKVVLHYQSPKRGKESL